LGQYSQFMCVCGLAIVRTHFAISSSFVCCEHLFRPLIELLAPRRQTSNAYAPTETKKRTSAAKSRQSGWEMKNGQILAYERGSQPPTGHPLTRLLLTLSERLKVCYRIWHLLKSCFDRFVGII